MMLASVFTSGLITGLTVLVLAIGALLAAVLGIGLGGTV